jgi:formate hydrogenlyase subunit 6/NADH:ubiquinone oxidoreductase subunit I
MKPGSKRNKKDTERFGLEGGEKMSTEIYYFSGTGNSLFIGKELQSRLPDSLLIPIVSLLDLEVGFVFPVHVLTIPIAVKRFLKKADFSSSEYLFAIATRGATIFKGFDTIDRILNKKNKHLDSHFIITMCNNEAPRREGYKVPSEPDIGSFENAALVKLDFIQNIIQNKTVYREKDTGYAIDVNYPTEKLVLAAMTLSEYMGGVNYFYADSTCIGCGICEKVCLAKKITMKEKQPVWQKKVFCSMCFACFNFCPRQSVQIKSIPGAKSFSRENERYPHPYAAPADIAAQKEYAMKT